MKFELLTLSVPLGSLCLCSSIVAIVAIVGRVVYDGSSRGMRAVASERECSLGSIESLRVTCAARGTGAAKALLSNYYLKHGVIRAGQWASHADSP